MNVLFSLEISCIEEENHKNYWAVYPIGLFRSAEEVDAVIKRLVTDGGKFSEPDCEARISKVEVVGDGVIPECVYRFWGQNIDGAIEGDTIESPCYVDKSIAIEALIKAKEKTPRQQWRLETHFIGKCNW